MIISKSLIPIPTPFEYRQGKNSDADEIVMLVSSILIDYGLQPAPDTTDADLQEVETAYKGGYFGVVTDRDKIIATFGLFPIATDVVEIRKMYLDQSYRGRGLGKWMLAYLLQMAKENKFSKVELETASSLVEAIGLYEKIGFREMQFDNKTPRCDKAYYLDI